MGEHEHSSLFTTGLLCSGIMRSSRGKLFVYVALLGTFFIIMFIFSRTHSNLKELEGVNQKCQQQRDSLSAQLQVVYEHKNRLEKSLQQEKSEHTHTKEECEAQHREMERKQLQDKDKQQSLEKKHSEISKSYSVVIEEKKTLENNMKEQMQFLQKQKDEDVKKLQTQLNDLLREKEALKNSIDEYELKLQQQVGEISHCQMQYKQVVLDLSSAREEMKKLQSHAPVAESPDFNQAVEEHKHATLSKINGETGDIHEREKNDISNVSFHKDKQVLMRPHIQPPTDIRKSISGINVPKYPRDLPDFNINHIGSSGKLNNIPMKYKVNVEPDANKKSNEVQDQGDNKIIPETNDIGAGDQNDKGFQEALNHPQVQPPHPFDEAAEHGELSMFQQNGMDDEKHQVEQPLNKGDNYASEMKNNNIGAYLQHNNGLAVPHLQSMIDAHSNDNYVHDKHMGQPFVNVVKRESHLNNDRIAEHGADGEDDDEDQDGENEEQLMAGPAGRGGKQFQDHDFEDQENAEMENAREEGVVVAPR